MRARLPAALFFPLYYAAFLCLLCVLRPALPSSAGLTTRFFLRMPFESLAVFAQKAMVVLLVKREPRP